MICTVIRCSSHCTGAPSVSAAVLDYAHCHLEVFSMRCSVLPGSVLVHCSLLPVVFSRWYLHFIFIWPIKLLCCLYLFRYVMYPFTTIYRHHSPLRHYVFTFCHCSPIHHCVFTVTVHCSPLHHLVFTYCRCSPFHHYVFTVTVHHFTTMCLLSLFTISPLCICCHRSPLHHYVFAVTVHHFTTMYLLSPFTTSPPSVVTTVSV